MADIMKQWLSSSTANAPSSNSLATPQSKPMASCLNENKKKGFEEEICVIDVDGVASDKKKEKMDVEEVKTSQTTTKPKIQLPVLIPAGGETGKKEKREKGKRRREREKKKVMRKRRQKKEWKERERPRKRCREKEKKRGMWKMMVKNVYLPNENAFEWILRRGKEWREKKRNDWQRKREKEKKN